jgi:hypothetical protein
VLRLSAGLLPAAFVTGILPVLLWAQPVEVRLHQPRQGQTGIEDMWWVDITNNRDTTLRGVWLFGEIHRDGVGMVFHARSTSFDVPPGRITKRLHDIGVREPWYRPGYEVFYYRAGAVPEGRYSYYVRLEPQLAEHSVGFDIKSLVPPRLFSPPDQSSFRRSERWPDFVWTPGSVRGRDESHTFRIFEVLEGQTVEEALAANRPWFEQTGLATTRLRYPLRARPLEPERRYAWQVTVSQGRHRSAASEAWSFDFGARGSGPESLPTGLPHFLSIGGFALQVLSYAPGASLANLAGRARSWFEHAKPAVTFELDFAELGTSWEPGQGETAHITEGRIVQEFGRPLVIQLSAAGARAGVSELRLDPRKAMARVSFELHRSLGDSAGTGPATIGPVELRVNPRFDVLESLPALEYGPFLLKELGLRFRGRGVVVDLSETRPTTELFWQGFRLDSGFTLAAAQETTNVGYLHARYRLKHVSVDSAGMDALLALDSVHQYTTLVPLGFLVGLLAGDMKLTDSQLDTAGFDVVTLLPDRVSWGKSQPVQVRAALVVDSAGNSRCDSVPVNALIGLGRTLRVHVTDGTLFFPADPWPSPVPGFADSGYQRNAFSVQLLTTPLPGLTFSDARNQLQTMWVRSEDVTATETLSVPVLEGWLNIGTRGAFGDVGSTEGADFSCWLGRPGASGYKADSVFFTDFRDSIAVVLVDNAVYDAWFQGFFSIPFPSDCYVPFFGLGFTSSGNAVGGKPVFDDTLELKYWGVGITSRSGAVSVRTGEILYTNAQIIEKRHFSQGFRIYWGEMLADGDLGRFHFDHNSGNQKFDTIPLTIHAAGLSPYNGDTTGDLWGYLKVSGDLSFPFWGAQFGTIYDHKYVHANHKQDPWNSRYVKLQPAQFALSRNWGSGTAVLDFPAVRYDSLDQDAFQATGTVKLMRGLTGTIAAQMDLSASGSLIGFASATKGGSGGGSAAGKNLLTGAGGEIRLGPVSGFVVIPGDQLERIFVEGPIEATGSAGWAGIGARIQFNGSVTAEITPSSFALGTMAGLSLNFSSVASIDGMCAAKFLFADTCFKGDIYVVFNTSPIQIGGEGQFSTYVGFPGANRPPAFYFQGAAKCWLYYFGRGMDAEGAVVIALNAPNSELWALGKIGRNVTARSLVDAVVPTTSRLTGFYGGGKFGGSIDLGIIAGGYWVWGGAGCFFVPDQAKFATLANAGILVHGDVLGFLASADLWAELGGAAAPPDFALQGACGFEVTVLFISYSWDGTISIGTGGIDAW